MSLYSLFETLLSSTDNTEKMVESAQKVLSSDVFDNKQYILVQWYLQQHGSFSSGGRWRDISLVHFTSTQQLKDHLIQYIQNNYQHIDLTNKQQYTTLDLCQIAIDQSNRLLASNKNEISRVTSRHIWPLNHQLLMGCLVDAHIVASYYNQPSQQEEQKNEETTYCLITQLGNHPTHVKFVHGTNSLREDLLQRFKSPFQTTARPSEQQIELFSHKCQTLSIQQLCHYTTNRDWYNLDNNALYGVLVDFIIAGEPLLFDGSIQ